MAAAAAADAAAAAAEAAEVAEAAEAAEAVLAEAAAAADYVTEDEGESRSNTKNHEAWAATVSRTVSI